MPQEALTAAGYTLTKHSAAAAAEGPKSQQRKRGRRTKVNSVEMVSLVRRVLAPHLQDTERVAVIGRGRNKKMVVAQHLRKKRYRVFLEEPELHESMSWSTFHSIMKRHFPHVKNPMRQTDICEHCKHLERHLLPAAQRALAKHRLEIEEFSQQYFHPFDSSPATIENKEKTDKFPLLATSLAFVQQQNFNAANSRERQALGLATRLALHSAEASAIHTLKGHVELLEAYRWHQTSARRQEAALEQLASGESLPASAVLLQMDFKENVRYPLSRPACLSRFLLGKSKLSLSCGMLRVSNGLPSKVRKRQETSGMRKTNCLSPCLGSLRGCPHARERTWTCTSSWSRKFWTMTLRPPTCWSMRPLLFFDVILAHTGLQSKSSSLPVMSDRTFGRTKTRPISCARSCLCGKCFYAI